MSTRAKLKQEVEQLDASDLLAHKRSEFLLPQSTIYLDGNSLGALPLCSLNRVQETAEKQWGRDLIGSWNKHGWIELPTKVGEKIAPLIGAAPGQTVACDSISVNLFKLLATTLQLRSSRAVILSQEDNFPTDLYMADGLSSLLGEQQCRVVKVPEEKLLDRLDESVAALLLTQVNFRSGRLLDIKKFTQRAHEVGALVIWDLAHSAGAVPLKLDEWNVDFAVGCGYKYLNGGPGAPAFVYAAARHLNHVEQPLKGWMGHATPFEFSANYTASVGIEKFLSGTPNILSLAALDGALEVFEGIDMAQIRDKSLTMARVFLSLVESLPSLQFLELISPVDEQQRGSQLAYRHADAYAISQALIDAGVIVDFRRPDCLRFGFTPLYTRYVDLYDAVGILADIMEERRYQKDKFQRRKTVT